jgi:hypothetical protein
MSCIISVEPVFFGGNGKWAQKRYGWNVIYFGGPPTVTEVRTTRTVSKNGQTLKRPVVEISIKQTPGNHQ